MKSMSSEVQMNFKIPTTEEADAASNNRLLILLGTLGALTLSASATGILFGNKIIETFLSH
jgi:hypothetical protein